MKSTIAASMLILHSLISSAEEDYTPVSTNVTFNVSTSTHTVNIPILDNEIVADSTMFSVSLTSADPAAILNPANADITIEDDDSEWLQALCKWDCVSCKFVTSFPLIFYSCIVTESECLSFSFFFYFLSQWSQSDSMEPIQCMKALVALMFVYLF